MVVEIWYSQCFLVIASCKLGLWPFDPNI